MGKKTLSRSKMKTDIRKLMQEPEELRIFSLDEIDDSRLNQLSHKYLTGCNSVFYFFCFRIKDPEPYEFIPQKLPLEKTVDSFVNDILRGPFGGMIYLTNEPETVGILQYMKKTTSNSVQKKDLFSVPILDALNFLNADLYDLSGDGFCSFHEQMDFVICMGVYFVSVQNEWYLLGCRWTD